MMSSISSFFFSSRRRHTRLQGDWSSDVCSSDLHAQSLSAVGDTTLASLAGRTRRPRLHVLRLLWMHDPLGLLLGYYVQPHEIRRAGGLTGASYHAEDLSGLQLTTTDQRLLRYGNHLLGRAGLLAAHRMDSPVEIHPLDHGYAMGESVDRGLGPIF